jgi:FkbM family methyltransferase
MMFNRNDFVIGRSIDQYGEWCEAELSLFRNVLLPGDTVLDVGANIGTHALGFARMVGPQGRVLAFEPQPLVFNLLCANMALNQQDHVRCLNKAVGIHDPLGGASIAVPRTPPDQPANFGNLSLRGAGGTGPMDQVDLIAIDDLGLQSCRLIKVDVQGMEAEVLRSATNTLTKLRPYLYVECEVAEQAGELIALMLAHNYALWWHAVPFHSVGNFYANPVDAFPNVSPVTNLLAIPAERDIPVNGLDPCLGVEDGPEKYLARRHARSA